MGKASLKQSSIVAQMAPTDVAYYGEVACERQGCKRLATYCVPGEKRAVCVSHADAQLRKKLPKNPNADNLVIADAQRRRAVCDERAALNEAAGRPGTLRCRKKPWRRQQDLVPEDTMHIEPNDKALQENANGVIGMCALSPKRLGPVAFGGKMGTALKHEDSYQQRKVYASEMDPKGELLRVLEDGTECRMPLTKYWANLERTFAEGRAQRHKDASMVGVPKGGKRLTPAYSLWVNPTTGKHYAHTYIESRFIYCHHYARLATPKRAFQLLKRNLARGYDICLWGYDGQMLDIDLAATTQREIVHLLTERYLDPSRNFGHELVLMCMLAIKDPKQYPWIGREPEGWE